MGSASDQILSALAQPARAPKVPPSIWTGLLILSPFKSVTTRSAVPVMAPYANPFQPSFKFHLRGMSEGNLRLELREIRVRIKKTTNNR